MRVVGVTTMSREALLGQAYPRYLLWLFLRPNAGDQDRSACFRTVKAIHSSSLAAVAPAWCYGAQCGRRYAIALSVTH